RPVRLRTVRVDLRLGVLALARELDASDWSRRRVRGDGPGEVSSTGRAFDDAGGGFECEEALMPGWLTWTLVGLGAWLVASVPFAFLAGYLLSRRTASHRRLVLLAGPG